MRCDALGAIGRWDQTVRSDGEIGLEIGKAGGASRALHDTGLVVAAQRVGLQRNVMA